MGRRFIVSGPDHCPSTDSQEYHWAIWQSVALSCMNVTLEELAAQLPARILAGEPTATVTGFASLEEAAPGDLSFFADVRYVQRLRETQASAVLVPADFTAIGDLPPTLACLATDTPSQAFETIVDRYGWHEAAFQAGIHPTAIIDPSVKANLETLSVGAHAVIEAGASIGDGANIGAGCYVGRGVRIGSGSRLHPNVTITEGCIIGDNVILHPGVVIGSDGFGYEFKQGRHRKVRQAGIVQIDNDVEIGSCTTIDRARFGRTWIGEGTKIDNQVQIAHNVAIGKHCIIVAGCGVAGSAKIGDYVVVAAQSGIGGHIKVGSQVTLAARSGVTKDIPAGAAAYMGFPAAPIKIERRRLAAQRQVPELIDRVRALEKQIAALTEQTAPA